MQHVNCIPGKLESLYLNCATILESYQESVTMKIDSKVFFFFFFKAIILLLVLLNDGL